MPRISATTDSGSGCGLWVASTWRASSQARVVDVRAPVGGPVLADPPVDEPRHRLAAHVPVGVLVREEVAEGADLVDHVHRQRRVVDTDPGDRPA